MKFAHKLPLFIFIFSFLCRTARADTQRSAAFRPLTISPQVRIKMNRKPGDWNCSSCDHLNFGWRESCQRCGDPKQDNGHAGRGDDRGEYGRRSSRSYGFGSGYSSGGGRYQGGNDDFRGSYRDRGDYRSNEYDGRGYGGSYGYGGSDVRPGDWHCTDKSCGAHNFATRTSCFKCGVPKDEEANAGRNGSYNSGRYDRGSRSGSYYDSGGSNRPGWKSGDWLCPRSECNEHNFASRTECFRCQTPREN